MASIVDQETDARFWAQTHYRPGQKLDPSNPADAKMIPIWQDINAKVKRDYDAGILQTTYDHPLAVQNIADASAASQTGVAHLDAAAATSDPATAQQHTAAATSAFDIVAQKLREVARGQPAQVSPQLAHEASQQAAQQPPPPSAPAADQVAHAQTLDLGKATLQPTHVATANSILEKETDARFWSQYHYKVGQKLDPSNPTDAKMIPLWQDIYRKVKAEDDGGRLVLTYNNPYVAQKLKEAQAADQHAAAQLAAAASAPDAGTSAAHSAAAAQANSASKQSTRDAAAVQPPSASPTLGHDAGKKIAADPWANTLPNAREQLAAAQGKNAGTKAAEVHRDARRRMPPRSATSRASIDALRAEALRQAHAAGTPFVILYLTPDGRWSVMPLRTRKDLDSAYAQSSQHHDQYKYVGAFDLQQRPNAPVNDAVGVAAAEHVETPATAAEPPAPAEAAPAPSGWSGGKIAAIAILGLVGLGGIAYAVTAKPKRKTSSPRRARPKTSVIVTTPTSATPGALGGSRRALPSGAGT